MKHFTLTELIFTLAAILIGGCLFAAAAGRSANQEEVSQCAFNLKRLGQAAFRYTDDNNGRLPETGFLDKNWQRKLMTYLIGKDAELKKALPMFHCPLDRTPLPSYMARNPKHIGKNSYCGNAYVIDIEGVDLDNDHVKGGQELKKLYGPDTIILFAEDQTRRNSIGQGPAVKFDRKGEYEYTIPNGTVKNDPGKAGYHGGRNNYLMLDGAVEFETYEYTVDPFFNKWIIRFGHR